MQWQIRTTPSGCALFVDGRMFGSPAVPPPSGWLQRQYGITMPIEYERARLNCQNGFAGAEEFPPYSSHGAATPGSCRHLTPPFAPGPPFSAGDCVWLEWEGWVYSPNNVPGAAGNMVLWSGQYDGLYDQPFVPHEHFLPNVYIQGYEEGRAGRLRGMNRPLERVVAGARATAPMQTRDCWFVEGPKGVYGCCGNTCRLLFRRTR